jgi:dihydrofolate reductase
MRGVPGDPDAVTPGAALGRPQRGGPLKGADHEEAGCDHTDDARRRAPGGPEEDPSGGFELGGWSVNYWDEAMQEDVSQAMARPFDLLLGRKTYEIFAAHWPYADDPLADALNGATKHVASRSLDTLDRRNSTLIECDVPEAVARLKAEDGPELQVLGSQELIQTLLAKGLIDELRLWILPVVVGSGKRLSGDGTVPAGFTLVDSRSSTTGVIIATYQVAGAIQTGSFAFEEPTDAEVQRRRSPDQEPTAG